MCKSALSVSILFLILAISIHCSSGEKEIRTINQKIKEVDTLINRNAVFAGSFYPASKASLNNTLSDFFSHAKPVSTENPAAIICPHAGYVYSGQVAASAYNQITEPVRYERVFILASSHRVAFQGASVYNIGNYETPLGEVKVDFKTSNELLAANSCFKFYPPAHAEEHSLEVQLPFLQKIFGDSLLIVPIVLGTQDKEVCKSLAATLQPYLNGKNLFVISSDFSHYPNYQDALLNDSITAEAICSNSSEILLNTLKTNESKGTKSLLTSLCGWTSVLTLLYMTEGQPNIHFQKIDYANSGNSTHGDKDRVVGYNAITAAYEPVSGKDEFVLNPAEKKQLLTIARKTLESSLNNKPQPDYNESEMSANLLSHSGAFVTLTENQSLRGCIGRFVTDKPLYQTIQNMAISAALNDSRFPNVKPDELEIIDIEISVLSPLKKINSIDEFELGSQGIYIKSGFRTGTFLPQVASETNWDKVEFISHCARDKTGIGWNGWKEPGVELFTYTAAIFSEKDE